MKPTLIAGLLASLAAGIAACNTGEVAPIEAPPGAPTTPAPDTGPPPDAGVVPTACSAPLPDPTCASTTPAPTSTTEIEKHLKETAIPIRCDSAADAAVWDLRPLVDLYGAQKMFMVGEVHGTNEIGIVSSLLLEQLATKALVNIVAFEMPMDTESSLQRYVDTGKDPMGEQIVRYGAKNFFGSILPRTARDLKTKGISLKIGAVDIPQSPDIAVTAIQAVADKLTTQKDVVLATLPTSTASPPSSTDVAAANAYFDHITSKKTEICAELSADDCDRLVAMTHALWASTLVYDVAGQDQLWFERREVVIYYNLRKLMGAPTDRMFLHMGAAHTNKHSFSAGSRMDKEYDLTKGRIFSIAPAWGDGSVIWYGQEMPMDADPKTLSDAFSTEPAHPFFVSTTRPTDACQENPLGAEPEESIGAGGTRAQLYDGYIHYGKLTSEEKPGDTALSAEDDVLGRSVASFRARIERREKAAIASGQLFRTRALGR